MEWQREELAEHGPRFGLLEGKMQRNRRKKLGNKN